MATAVGRTGSAVREVGRVVEQLAGGFAELLATPHGADRYLEMLRPQWVRHEIRAVVTAVRHQTTDSVTVTLRPNRAWRGFTAGQYLRVTVDVNGVLHSRCYSPANSQHGSPPEVELTIAYDPQGMISPVLNATRPGTVLRLSAAAGTFTMPVVRPDRLLFISGGAGITPVLSMLRTLCDENHHGEMVFLHYADNPADATYREELTQLAERHPNVRVVHAYTDPKAGGELPGFFGARRLARVAPWYRMAQTYLCGPPSLTEAVTSHYRTEGLLDRLQIERFALPIAHRPTWAGSATTPSGTVTFSRSGVTVPNDGRTLLDQAEAAGLHPDRGCGMGICFGCIQVKTSGTVRNTVTGHEQSGVDEEIQPCVCVPVGDVELRL